MKEANVAAFANLRNQLLDQENINSVDGKRYIKTKDDEKHWLKELKILESKQILPNLTSVMLKLDEDLFFCLIGEKFISDNFDFSIIEEQNTNAGLVTLLISKNLLRINSNINFIDFDDKIMHQHEDKDYSGHDYADFLEYLNPIYLYKILNNSQLYNQGLNRVLAYIYTKNPNNLILKFDDNVLNKISEIALIGSPKISYNLVISCLLSTNFRHSFLELYRLVERLFSISYLKELYIQVDTKISFLQFSAHLEDITGWRPKEEEALKKIFSLTKPSTLTYFDEFLCTSIELSSQQIHSYFYKLRNSIVHFRPNQANLELTDFQWNLLIVATFNLLDEHYSSLEELN